MDEKSYRIVKTVCLLVSVGALFYIGAQLSDIKQYLSDIASLIVNQ
ncbi:hypothetical protein [Bacillus sp. EAC]|nr:hypothetical protein [Bacillus sp. EAC]